MIGHDASEFRPVLTRCWSSAEIQGMSGEKCRIDDAPKIDIKASPLDPHRGESFGWSYFVSSRTIGSRCSTKGIPDINNPAADGLNGLLAMAISVAPPQQRKQKSNPIRPSVRQKRSPNIAVL